MDERDIEQLLKASHKTGPSDVVWMRIQSKIIEEQAAVVSRMSIIENMMNAFYAFRPVIVTLCLFFMVAVGIFIKQNNGSQEPYLSYVMGTDTSLSDDISDGIETYFL